MKTIILLLMLSTTLLLSKSLETRVMRAQNNNIAITTAPQSGEAVEAAIMAKE